MIAASKVAARITSQPIFHRCEWYNDYEKGITKPPIRVSDIEVVELNFRGHFPYSKYILLHGRL
jgi:hypothetical protein